MLNHKLIETVSAQLSELFEGGRGLPGQEAMRQQVRAVLQSSLARLDLVTRHELDAPAAQLGPHHAAVDPLAHRTSDGSNGPKEVVSPR